ncbi:hypothetical protein [Nocardia transvalensis]|uniref:hypothetical protein n=1 Tax=Nocardia transvalensis TaxID=37333 RepID=UPI001893853A|nr:hypothetical protein [Nocardia transvalensis]MBF6329653.1 hypothetical protein [Nocardia transvalensis]
MTAGSGTPGWVRALRAISVIIGVVAFIWDELRTLTTTITTFLTHLRPTNSHPLPNRP